MANRPEYIIVGRFGRPHGVSGEIVINPLTDNPDRFQKTEGLWVNSEGEWKELAIDSVRNSSGRPIVKITGIETPEQARIWTNEYIYVQLTALEELPAGNYYDFDLIGCRVVNLQEAELGTVVDIDRYPANNVLVIESETGVRHYLPAVTRFLKEIDIEKKLIIADPPDGIFGSPNET